MRRRPYPASHEQVEEIERQIQECIDSSSLKNIGRGTTPITAVPASRLLNLHRLPCDCLLNMVTSNRKPKTTWGVFPTWKTCWSVLPNAGTKPKWTGQWLLAG